MNSCKKNDFRKDNFFKDKILTKFFQHSTTIDPTVEAIMQSVKRQNDERDFVERLSKSAGYPLWDKAIVSQKDEKKQVFIPFVLEDGIQTKAILIARLSGGDTLYHLMYGAAYKKYGFDKNVKDRWTAREVFTAFAIFDKEIFGYKKFIVKDDRLLGADINITNNQPRVVILKDSIVEQNARVQTMRYYSHTTTWIECGVCYVRTTVDESCCNATYYTEVVTFWFDDGFGGGGEDWGWYIPQGGGGGGGTPCPGCNWDYTNPCEEQDPNAPQFPCDQDWRPVINASMYDYYQEWGYQHFETWNMTPEDLTKIENWRNNNLDTVGLDSCVRKLLDKILSSDNLIGRLLGKMDRSNDFPLNIEKFKINIRVDTLSGGLVGKTKKGHFNSSTQVFTDTIILKDSLVMFGTQLAVAQTIIHELIHAYMKSIFHRFFYNSYTANEISGLNIDTLFNVYVDTLLARHTRFNLNNWISTNTEYDHNFMADKLINQMKEIIAYIDDNRNSDEFYWVYNWDGLGKTTTLRRYWPNFPAWAPTAGSPAPSNDSTWGLRYAFTEARLDSLSRWANRENKGLSSAKGRPKIPGGCY